MLRLLIFILLNCDNLDSVTTQASSLMELFIRHPAVRLLFMTPMWNESCLLICIIINISLPINICNRLLKQASDIIHTFVLLPLCNVIFNDLSILSYFYHYLIKSVLLTKFGACVTFYNSYRNTMSSNNLIRIYFVFKHFVISKYLGQSQSLWYHFL